MRVMLAAVAEEEVGVEEEAVDEVEQQKEKLLILRLVQIPAHRFSTATDNRTLTH